MPYQTMDGDARSAYERQSLQIRAELKQWEGDWAAARGGRKPGRDDIKQNADIARKYKQYNRLRDILAGKIPPPPAGPAEAADGSQQRKRTQSDAAIVAPQTPSKRSRPTQTPRKTQYFPTGPMPSAAHTPGAATAMNTPPLNRTLFTPAAAVPTSISPTPQRDGRVLGIFDLLGRTPSRSTALSTALPGRSIPVSATTPSRRRTTDPAAPPAISISITTTTTPTTARFTSTSTSTPQSKPRSSVPLYERPGNSAAPFRTPSTNRVARLRLTPQSGSKTPSFLRRRTTSSAVATTATITTAAAAAAAAAAANGGLSRVDEQGDDEADDGDEDGGGDGGGAAWKRIGPLRLPRTLALGGRGLSSVVAGLRRMEDEEFGEEEEAMREMEMEMEMEMEGGAGGGGGPVRAGTEGGLVEVGDSQVGPGPARGLAMDEADETTPIGLLSGFDNEGRDDHLDQEKPPAQPLRIFKKRGQKRSTRLVNMRPTRSRRPVQAGEEDADADDDDDDDDLVPETQFDPSATSGPRPDGDDALLSEDAGADSDGYGSGSDDDDDDDNTKDKAKTKAKKKTTAKTKTKTDGKDANKSEGVVKRAVRKVKATAHANFKRLKLKNNGAKGGPGHNSRFRRRR
ncbi:hypothetical protein BT67DRAFT_458298 [Trichocladium antarcticum]|uniref:DNA replication regulator SLD2 n=1 Tax=Trichocladium antarcticum TaxID=1450529 RepID=A0AAN6UE96_9PEZI|nr:hypothetical protein BT67DRAFT_458298 [Trichocladium antarcticum]